MSRVTPLMPPSRPDKTTHFAMRVATPPRRLASDAFCHAISSPGVIITSCQDGKLSDTGHASSGPIDCGDHGQSRVAGKSKAAGCKGCCSGRAHKTIPVGLAIMGRPEEQRAEAFQRRQLGEKVGAEPENSVYCMCCAMKVGQQSSWQILFCHC